MSDVDSAYAFVDELAALRPRVFLLDRTAAPLAGLLGTDLPPEARPSPGYSGPPRVIVPTLRGSAFERESLGVRVLVLAESPPESGTLYWRRFGGRLHQIPLRHVDRGVYIATLPSRAARGLGFEYYVEVRFAGSEPVRFPRAAPERMQTVVVNPWRGDDG